MNEEQSLPAALPPEGHPALDPGRARPRKAPNAFRTISEVADELHIPQHVLRFWETKFAQVKPLKRGGGRRYYRPDDIALLRRISDLLYIQGYTIKGVQRLLREGGGKLSDDIPPPPAEERAEAADAAAEFEEPQLPMPGLMSISPTSSAMRATHAAGGGPGRAAGSAAVPAEGGLGERRLAEENARLRGLLFRTLRALEELRALAP